MSDQPGFYATIQQVFDYFDPPELVALCATKGEGTIAEGNAALTLCRGMAHVEVTSNLATIYGEAGLGGIPTETPGKISMLLVTAECAYIKFFLYNRKPALAAKIQGDGKFLEALWTFAEGRMDRIKDSVQEIAVNDNPPAEPPANVGGVTYDRGPPLASRSCPGKRANYGDF